MMTMDFLWCKKKVKIVFVIPGVIKLIINEHDVFVRTFKKAEYTSQKLYENKGRT